MHELLVLNGGMCGGCEVCGTREERYECSCGGWSSFDADGFDAHVADEADVLVPAALRGDDPWPVDGVDEPAF